MKLQKTMLGCLVIAAIGGTNSASAAPITVTGWAYPNGQSVNIQSTLPNKTINGVGAGGFATTDGTSSFISWCVDILQYTYFGSAVNDYTVINAATMFDAARANALGQLATQYLGSVTNTTTSAAFQLAVWEIVYETGSNPFTLASGNFKASNNTNAINQANTWLGSLSGTSTYSTNVLQSGTRQDLLTFTTVPEPSMLALFGIGLAGLGFAKRKQAKKQQDAV